MANRWIVGTACLAFCASCSSKSELTVFAAASLGPTLYDIETAFEAAHPEVDVRTELSGSRLACAKVADQGRQADLVLSSDFQLIDTMLLPNYADFNLLFASNALVIAYTNASSVAQDLRAGQPWQTVLSRPGVRVGAANPAMAPVGYRALLALQLNDQIAADALRTGQVIANKLTREFLRPDVTKLIAPLEAGEVDAAFVYRTEAMLHELPFVELDERINFSNPELQDEYAKASLEIAAMASEPARSVNGSAVIYGLTIPRGASKSAVAEQFVEFLFAGIGQRLAARNHLNLLGPGERRVNGELPSNLLRVAEKR